MMKKRVLIISYFYFHQHEIGSIRIHGLCKHLQAYGWEPIVVTVSDSNTGDTTHPRIITTPIHSVIRDWKSAFGLNPQERVREKMGMDSIKEERSVINRLYLLWKEIFLYPDDAKSWYPYAVSAIGAYLEKNKIDAIISSSCPYTCHVIAQYIHSKYRIPWIADFRDLWTEGPYYEYSPLRRRIERRLEIKTIRKASRIVAVSDLYAEELQKVHPFHKIEVIHNGLDEESIQKDSQNLDAKFSITHTGTLRYGRRDPETLFQAINELISEKKIIREDLAIHFYGEASGWLLNEANVYNLQSVTHIHGIVSREKALSAQRSSQILLLLTWNDPFDRGMYPGKLFDYLTACRPILSIGYSDAGGNQIIHDVGAGYVAHTIEEIKDFISLSYDEYRNTGAVPYSGDRSKLSQYSHEKMAEKFANALNTL